MTTNSTPLKVGSLVVSSDGKIIGRVKAVEGSCFKLDAPVIPDFWLPDSLAEQVEINIVRLTITQLALQEERMHPSGHAGFHQHTNVS